MKKYVWTALSFFLAGLIFYLSFVKPTDLEGVPSFDHQDKLGHFIFYAAFGWMMAKSLAQEISVTRPIAKAALVAFAYGGLVELGQFYFTTDREGSFLDALANGLGIVSTVGLIKTFPKWFLFYVKN